MLVWCANNFSEHTPVNAKPCTKAFRATHQALCLFKGFIRVECVRRTHDTLMETSSISQSFFGKNFKFPYSVNCEQILLELNRGLHRVD